MIAVRKFQAGTPDIDFAETIRYMGIRQSLTDQLRALAYRGIQRVKRAAVCRGCYARVPITVGDGWVVILDSRVESRSLAKHLRGCDEGYLMAATVGIGVDRLIHRLAGVSPAESLAIDAAGGAAVEWVCDELCRLLESEAGSLRHRFSPGYGDFSLDFQRDMMKYLDMWKNCGITLSDGLMMTPTKSVTAIVGIERNSNV